MRNFKLTICYDGTKWKGWQAQENTDQTIQGRLEGLLTRLLGQPIKVIGSGRTDRGVHARGQVASFQAETDMVTEDILEGIRRYLPEDIGAISLVEASPRFHARLSCDGKVYVYRIWNSDLPNVFERNYLYFMNEKLDVEAMRRAAQNLCGRHDYRAFCSLRRMHKTTVRTVDEIKVEELGPELRLTFIGEGFLYHMVRIMAGTLVAVGQGKMDPDKMQEIIASRDREQAGETLPACGLCLESVWY